MASRANPAVDAQVEDSQSQKTQKQQKKKSKKSNSNSPASNNSSGNSSKITKITASQPIKLKEELYGINDEEVVVEKIWGNAKTASDRLLTLPLPSIVERNQEFRRRFLLGLEFYCGNPSLILNSDLPADLVEFVSKQGAPIEALGVILELKKNAFVRNFQQGSTKSSSGSASSFAGGEVSSTTFAKGAEFPSQNSQNPGDVRKLSELSRKLVEYWMSSDSCAEALVSLSLGDEIPGLIAETSNFHRLLFAISDCFNLSAESFLKFLLDQFFLTIKVLVYAIREKKYGEKIRSQSISSLLDRIFVRFHSDPEHFFESSSSQKIKRRTNPFIQFVADLNGLCKEDFIARRITTKILTGFGNHTATKFAKTVFLVGYRESCAAPTLFYPQEDFLSTSHLWKTVLNYNIPLKSCTKSTKFWSNWAFFIFSYSVSITEVWQNCVRNWESLCVSSAVNNTILIPATYALVALGREIKVHHGEKSAQILLSAVKVFDNVAKCLDSTSEEKKACGMALAQVMGDLHTFTKSAKETPEEKKEKAKKLRFNSSNPVFHELVDYYENGYELQEQEEMVSSGTEKLNSPRRKKVEVLDSDDEMEDDETEDVNLDVKMTEEEIEMVHAKFEGGGEEDFEIDEKLLDYRRKKGKLPTYFSEIIEIFIEGGGQSKDEYEVEALKKLCVMKIPFLLSGGVRIDANMGEVLVKCLIDYESNRTMEVPVILALYEISSLHPQETFEILSKIVFDKEQYTYGQRMLILRRFSEIIQHHCKTMCFNCYSKTVTVKRTEYLSFCAEFVKNYYEVKSKLRFCSNCASSTNSNKKKIQEEEFQKSQQLEEEFAGEETPTWRQIVDRRVKAKTRYFFTSKRKTPLVIPDDYSSKLVPIIWASVANKLVSKAGFFLDDEERRIRGAPHDTLLAQIFRLLGRIIMGLQGPSCPHFGSIAAQVGELIKIYILHKDASVRLAVIALLAITVSVSDGASYVIEALSGGQNIFELLKLLRTQENSEENIALIDHSLAFLAQATAMDYRLEFSNLAGSSSSNEFPSQLRILPDIL